MIKYNILVGRRKMKLFRSLEKGLITFQIILVMMRKRVGGEIKQPYY
ncbi:MULTISPECIES: hypothetical protein [Elizabethkingia]|nr:MULTISPECIES: hypothetical protein [Elizabethkingia]MCL1033988.1 hypothetical protein [Elizabethkingia anophelis]MCL1652904.1 hypothetical protein [Elizabethkingia miricola]MCL1679979.1 hypothetical protein [Elizabethkingia miricola]